MGLQHSVVNRDLTDYHFHSVINFSTVYCSRLYVRYSCCTLSVVEATKRYSFHLNCIRSHCHYYSCKTIPFCNKLNYQSFKLAILTDLTWAINMCPLYKFKPASAHTLRLLIHCFPLRAKSSKNLLISWNF